MYSNHNDLPPVGCMGLNPTPLVWCIISLSKVKKLHISKLCRVGNVEI